MKTIDEKYSNVIQKNTFYYFDEEFEQSYENHIFSVKEAILYLKNEVAIKGCKKDVFEEFLKRKKDLGLKALLAITGFSNEGLKRLITVLRIVDNEEIKQLVFKEKWCSEEGDTEIAEWGTSKIENLVETNNFFRKGLINIFLKAQLSRFFASHCLLLSFRNLVWKSYTLILTL